MKKHKEQKVFYKLMFSMGQITEEESIFVRKAMEKLETEDEIMRCFQNVHGNVLDAPESLWPNPLSPDFSIYYRGIDVDCVNRFLFKIQLKFPNFKVETIQTLQEYYS